jgi:hypothetical protein
MEYFLYISHKEFLLLTYKQQLWEIFAEVELKKNHMKNNIINRKSKLTLILTFLDLNAMKVRSPNERLMIEANSGGGNSPVRHEINYSDHPLVVGDRYQPKDIKLMSAIRLGSFTSGLMSKINNKIFDL